MPDNKERRLPFINKLMLYHAFQGEFKLLSECVVSLGKLFLRCVEIMLLWYQKIRKHSRFTKCGTCERLRNALQHAVSRNLCTDTIFEQKRARKQLANWSGLCEETDFCNDIDRIMQFRFFRFTRSTTAGPNTSTAPWHSTTCDVKCVSSDTWKPLEEFVLGAQSLLTFVFDLTQTPPEEITSPPDVNKYTARIESESARVKSKSKIKELPKLRTRCSETGQWRFTGISPTTSSWPQSRVTLPMTEVNHLHWKLWLFRIQWLMQMGYTTALIHLSEWWVLEVYHSLQFWIAQVLDVYKSKAGVVTGLSIQWFEFHGNIDHACWKILR